MVFLRLSGGAKLCCPANFKRKGSTINPLIIHNDQGNIIEIHTLEHNIVRIIHTPSPSSKNGHKLSYDNHNTPKPTIESNRSFISLKTEAIILTITLDNITITWSDLEGNIFLEDLKYRAYEHDLEAGCNHYVSKQSNVFYGLGEKASPLNLNGRSFKLDCLDALGYDAQLTDPLYKNYPFYISLINNAAYGMYYASHCESTMDFGNELDALWGTLCNNF
jgi:alpha-glucosidase